MTIKELIEELKKYNENLDVKVRYFYDPINRADISAVQLRKCEFKKNSEYVEII